ncbi:MAG: bacterial extracellular solute-binding family protein [Rhodoferax sp.]|nr:bacterial extracellular solute-binding family protein [Rhodoferax sp.]
MDILNIVSAGAAQAVVERVARRLEAQGGCTVQARFGPVQAMHALVRAGEAVDVIVLTDVLMDALAAAQLVLPGSCAALGSVGTGLAVRAGLPLPDIASLEALRATLLRCDRLVCPDPAVATAGKLLLEVLDRLGIAGALQPRLVRCRSGDEALAELARGVGANDIGVMQITEIIAGEHAGQGIRLAGPLPAELQKLAVYAAGLAAHGKVPARASAFMQALLADRVALRAAGFGDCAPCSPS